MKAYVLLVVVVVAVFSLAIGGCEALLGDDSDEVPGRSESNGTGDDEGSDSVDGDDTNGTDTDTEIDDGTGDDGTAGDDGIPIDPYADLRSQAESSGYATDGDVTCYYDCYYDELFCGQQNGEFAAVGSTLDSYDLDQAPSWWRTGDWYLFSNYEINILPDGEGADHPDVYYVGKMCSDGSNYGVYTYYESFADAAAFEAFLLEGEPNYNCQFILEDCDGGDDGGTEPLTSVEQQLVGKWARYHAYDGSYRFRIYYSDRTGCEFEVSSSGYRSGEACYVNWELNSLGSNVYAIERTSTTGGTYAGDEFHYTLDQVWQGGYDNLVLTPYTGSYDCNCD